uniref:Nipped-B protein n=1 Tax=Rhabditophanes sp. KR3021 TaxID=114890 RepID=A0AC35TPL9_9BILA
MLFCENDNVIEEEDEPMEVEDDVYADVIDEIITMIESKEGKSSLNKAKAWSSKALSEEEAICDLNLLLAGWKDESVWGGESELVTDVRQLISILYSSKNLKHIEMKWLERTMNAISSFPDTFVEAFSLLSLTSESREGIKVASTFTDIAIIGLQIITSRVGLKLNNEEFVETVFDLFSTLIEKFPIEAIFANDKEMIVLKSKCFTIFDLFSTFFQQFTGWIGFSSRVMNELTFMVLNIFQSTFKIPIMKCLTSVFTNSEDQCHMLTELIINSNAVYQFENNQNGTFENAFTILLLTLVQSIFQVRDFNMEEGADFNDSVNMLLLKFKRSEQLIDVITSSFLIKMKQKDIEKYERLAMLKFVNELIRVVFMPEFPAAERIIISIVSKLNYNYLEEKNDLVVRNACITISSELCKMLIKENLYDLDHFKSMHSVKLNDIKTHQQSGFSVKKNNLLKALKVPPKDYCTFASVTTDYLKRKEGQSTIYDYKSSRNYQIASCLDYIINTFDNHSSGMSDKALAKQKIMLESMKKFFVFNLKNLYTYSETKSSYLLTPKDVILSSKMMLIQKELNNYVGNFFKIVISSLRQDIPNHLRVTATKCLTSIVELNYELLDIPLLAPFMSFRTIDNSAQSREVHVSFLAKCFVAKPAFMGKYFKLYYDRLSDQSVMVRKCVILSLPPILNLVSEQDKCNILKDIISRTFDEPIIRDEVTKCLEKRWFDMSYFAAYPPNIFKEILSVMVVCVKNNKEKHFINVLRKIKPLDYIGMNKFIGNLIKATLDFINSILYGQEESSKSSLKNLSASLSLLRLLTEVRPECIVEFIEIMLPYVDLMKDNKSLLPVFYDLLTAILNGIDSLKTSLPFFAMNYIEESVCGLLLMDDFTTWELSIKILSCIRRVWKYKVYRGDKIIDIYAKILGGFKEGVDKGGPSKILYKYGLFVRYYGIEFFKKCQAFEGYANDQFVIQKMFSLILKFAMKATDPLSMKVVIKCLTDALIAYPVWFNEANVVTILQTILKHQECPVLGDIKYIIVNAILIAIEKDEKVVELKSKAIQLDSDLKVLNVEEDSLPFKILNNYYSLIINMDSTTSKMYRVACYKLISLNISTGILNPFNSISHAIAFLCDEDFTIDNEICELMKNTERKAKKCLLEFMVQGMVRGKQFIQNNHNSPRAFYIKGNKGGNLKKTLQSEQVISYFNSIYKFVIKYKHYRRVFFEKLINLISQSTTDYNQIQNKMFLADAVGTLDFSETDSVEYIIKLCDVKINCEGGECFNKIRDFVEKTDLFKENEYDGYSLEVLLQIVKVIGSNQQNSQQFVDILTESCSIMVLLELRKYLLKRYKISMNDNCPDISKLIDYNTRVISYKDIQKFELPINYDGAARTIAEYISNYYDYFYET